MKKLISIIFVILSMSFTAQTAQAQVNDLSEQDIQAFKDRVGEVYRYVPKHPVYSWCKKTFYESEKCL